MQRAVNACLGPLADPMDLRRGTSDNAHPTAPDEPVWVRYDAFGPTGQSATDRSDYAAFIAATTPNRAQLDPARCDNGENLETDDESGMRDDYNG